jgi:hypothetical protein
VTRSTNGPLFKREKAGAGRSVAHLTHDVLATVPLVMRHINVKSGQPPRLSQKIGGPEPMGCDAAAHGQVAPGFKPKENNSQGAGRQLEARSSHQPVRPWNRHVPRRPATLPRA